MNKKILFLLPILSLILGGCVTRTSSIVSSNSESEEIVPPDDGEKEDDIPAFRVCYPDIDKNIRLGARLNNSSTYLFFSGAFSISNGLETTTDFDSSSAISTLPSENPTNGFYIRYALSDSSYAYLGMSANHKIGRVGSSTAPDINNHNTVYEIENSVWEWDDERKTFKQSLEAVKDIIDDSKTVYEGGDYYIGAFNNSSTLDACYIEDSNFNSLSLAHFYTPNVGEIVGMDTINPGQTQEYQVVLPEGITSTPTLTVEPLEDSDASKMSINPQTGEVTASYDALNGSKYNIVASWGDGENQKTVKEVLVDRTEYSIYGVKKHFDEIGITDVGSSGKQIAVTALIVGLQGDNLYLRDVLIDEEQYREEGANARLEGCYAYAGYGTSLASLLQNASTAYGMDGTGIGLVIRFFCRATTYNGNVQLSDMQVRTTGTKALKILTDTHFTDYFYWSHHRVQNGYVTYNDLNKNVDSIVINQASIDSTHRNDNCKYLDLLPYTSQLVTLEMTIRAVKPTDDLDSISRVSRNMDPYWCYSTMSTNSYTVYAKFAGKDGEDVICNIRIDQSINPFVSRSYWGTEDPYDVSSVNSPVGHTWRVTGLLVRYFEGFQMQLGNNYIGYNYLVKIS